MGKNRKSIKFQSPVKGNFSWSKLWNNLKIFWSFITKPGLFSHYVSTGSYYQRCQAVGTKYQSKAMWFFYFCDDSYIIRRQNRLH